MYTNLAPVSKTIRFRLIPMFETEQNIHHFQVLQKEELRFKAYKNLKPYLSAYHSAIFENAFATIAEKHLFDLESLADAYDKYVNTSEGQDEAANAEAYYNSLESCYKILEEQVMSSPLYKQLDENNKPIDVFSTKFFSDKCDLFPSWVKLQYANDQDKAQQIVKDFRSFSQFASYFSGFNEAKKKTLYSFVVNRSKSGGKIGSMAQRILNDNFAVYLQNKAYLNVLLDEYPQIIESFEKEMTGVYDRTHIKNAASVSGFFKCLTGEGIDWYNQMISGFTNPDKSKLQGFNELINLWNQSHPSEQHIRFKLTKLKKALLAEKSTRSWIPEKIEDDKNLKTVLEELHTNNILFVNADDYKDPLVKLLVDLLQSVNAENASQIYIKDKGIHYLSNLNTGSFNTYRKIMENYAAKAYAGKTRKAEQERERFLGKEYHSIASIIDILHGVNYDKDGSYSEVNSGTILASLVDELKQLGRQVVADYMSMMEAINACDDCITNNIVKSHIKTYLDRINKLSQIHSFFDISTSQRNNGDSEFYIAVEQIGEAAIAQIYQVYNKVRNYLTRTPQEREDKARYKLTLDAPALGAGWDCDMENTRNCVFLSDGHCSYVLILNNSKEIRDKYGLPKKPKFEELEVPGGERIQKLVYKQFSGAAKMLPKIFFSKDNPAKYGIPDEFMRKYNEKRHTKSGKYDMDPVFLAEYIDKCKELIREREEWKIFNFKFKPTPEYTSIDLFYRDIEEQGYAMAFTDVSLDKVKQWVAAGSAYLFKLWNKDFSERAKGRENLHTIYWKALFSNENMTKRSIRLCGGAEFFYRPQVISNDQTIIHRKGSILVNKVTTDGYPVPEDVYEHLKAYHNNRPVELTDEDREYLPKVKHRVAPYDIVKNRNYTHDNYYMHIPIVFNKTAPGKSVNLNESFIRKMVLDKNMNIMSVRRGRNNLLYAAVIDKKGNLLAGRSYNILSNPGQRNNIDYSAKLKERSKRRQESRKSWEQLESIKNIKNGYLTLAIGEIVSDLRRFNAVLVLEYVSDTFKNKMSALEDTLYKGFETALLSKLNYLVYKIDTEGNRMNPEAEGGVLNGLQYTAGKDLSRYPFQNGAVFFVPSAYTAEVDLNTGYYNMLTSFKATRLSVRQQRELIHSFDKFYYDKTKDEFIIDINWAHISQTATRKGVIDKVFRLHVDDTVRSVNDLDVTGKPKTRNCKACEELKKLLGDRIEYKSGRDLRQAFDETRTDKRLISEVLNIIAGVISMRHHVNGDNLFISPVADTNGKFYTCEESDLTAAMCIGYKLLFLYHNRFAPAMAANKMDKINRSVSNEDWLQFIQNWKKKI